MMALSAAGRCTAPRPPLVWRALPRQRRSISFESRDTSSLGLASTVATALALRCRGRRGATSTAATSKDAIAAATYTQTWSNPSGSVLTALSKDLWVAERPFIWNSIDEECREPDVLLKPCSEVGGKMAVVRLPDGGLWVHSPDAVASGANARYLENLYLQWKVNPAKLDSKWNDYFRSLEASDG
eukprot:s14_g1.t1